MGDALRRVGMAVGPSTDLDELLTLVVDTTTEVLDADRATLYLRDRDVLTSRVKQGRELATIEVAVGQGIAGHVAKTGRVIRVRDAYADKRFDPSWDEKSGYRTRSIMAVPICDHEGACIGVLQVLNKRGARGGRALPFTRYDSELASALATQVAVSLDNASLIRRLVANNAVLEQTKERLERSLRDLELLYELETAMARADTIEEMARHAIQLTARRCDAQAGALLHAAGGALTLYVVNMRVPDEVRPVVVRQGEGIAARAMESGKLLRIDHPSEVRDPRRVRGHLGITLQSAVAAPLGDAEHPIGAIALYNHTGKPSRFTEHDGALLKLVSANVSTELRVFESRRARERAERMGSMGRLLSGVIHDLRTPLTVISGYVQLMTVSEDTSLRAQYSAVIAEQFEVIAAMQKDLLAYARGETSLLIRKVFLGAFSESIARQFRPELEKHGIVLEVKLDSSGVAFFDERRMSRAIGNLVQNAIEAMRRGGGTLTLHFDRDGDDLVLGVGDTGGGIPKAVRSRLFEPFVTSGKKMGTGLGLANVKKIVDEHGGDIDVLSSRSGTTFRLIIKGAMRPRGVLGGVLRGLAPRSGRRSVKGARSKA